MRTPQQSRSSTSTDRMLDAVMDLLAEGGLTAVTVAAVAREASTSNGSLYHRFGDRTGLLLAAQDRAMGRIETETAAAFATVDAGAPDEAIDALVAAALAIFSRHHVAMRGFLIEGAHLPEFEERSVRSSHLLATTVTTWLTEQFGATPSDAQSAYRLLFSVGAGQALFSDAQISPEPHDAAGFAAAMERALRAVLARPAG